MIYNPDNNAFGLELSHAMRFNDENQLNAFLEVRKRIIDNYIAYIIQKLETQYSTVQPAEYMSIPTHISEIMDIAYMPIFLESLLAGFTFLTDACRRLMQQVMCKTDMVNAAIATINRDYAYDSTIDSIILDIDHIPELYEIKSKLLLEIRNPIFDALYEKGFLVLEVMPVRTISTDALVDMTLMRLPEKYANKPIEYISDIVCTVVEDVTYNDVTATIINTRLMFQ